MGGTAEEAQFGCRSAIVRILPLLFSVVLTGFGQDCPIGKKGQMQVQCPSAIQISRFYKIHVH